MDRAITRVAIVVALMFGVLIAFTSRWTVFEAEELRQNALNRRSLLREQQQPRGPILAANRRAIARSYPSGRGQSRVYRRRYTRPTIYAHPVGYSFVDLGSSGLESYYNDQLSGDREELLTVLDQLLGRRQEGRTMVTDLDPQAQQLAGAQLAGRAGAVVVIEPRTGRVPVYVSVPGYNQNDARDPVEYARLRRMKDSPLFDRVSQSGYPPGSTFKVVTATAALDSGAYKPESVVNGDSPKEISGQPLANAGGQSFGDVSLTMALTNSINTVWAQVGEDTGGDTLFEYMDRYGFNRKPPVDLPRGEVTASGVRDSESGRLIASADDVDVGRIAIGQERLAVTPLQMATVAATLANGGVRMEPRLAREFRDRDGRVAKTIHPRRATRVMSARTAAELTEMMARVVGEGTGTAAALQGVSVAGKTGTAERGNDTNTAWFIGFAPVERPRYAIAVAVEKTTGSGGTIAAPIAKGVLESLLNR